MAVCLEHKTRNRSTVTAALSVCPFTFNSLFLFAILCLLCVKNNEQTKQQNAGTLVLAEQQNVSTLVLAEQQNVGTLVLAEQQNVSTLVLTLVNLLRSHRGIFTMQ
jgi:hypothetical protein